MNRQNTLTAIVEQSLTPLKPLLEGDSISEIMANADGTVWIEESSGCYQTDITLSDGERRAAAQAIARSVDQEVSDDRPLCDARLPDGSRVAISFPPVSVGGIALTIRKFRKRGFTLDELVQADTMTQGQAICLSTALKIGMSILLSGATGSGKTTLLNAMLRECPDERLAVIEDTAELQIPEGANCVRLEAKREMPGAPEVTIRHLVRHAMRNRPDRIIVGEFRGAEAYDALKAMNTGHGGTMSTIHAESPLGALQQFAAYAMEAGTGIPYDSICERIVKAIQLVVQMGRDGSRRVVTEIARPRWVNGRFGVEPVEMGKAANG